MAVYVWCWAHQLNLVMTDLVNESNITKNLFGYLEKTFDFIRSSKKRVSIYEENQKCYPQKQIK